MSIPELKASFPVSAERKAQFDILLRHIDAQATPERCPLSELEGVLIGAIQRGDADFLTTQVAQLAFGAHIGYHPRQTVDVLQRAYDAFLEKYPAAPSPDEPTASLWLHILIFAFDTLKFADRTRVSGDEATTMLTILATMVHTAETRYFSAVRYKTGGMQRTSLIGAVTAWSYQLNFCRVSSCLPSWSNWQSSQRLRTTGALRGAPGRKHDFSRCPMPLSGHCSILSRCGRVTWQCARPKNVKLPGRVSAIS